MFSNDLHEPKYYTKDKISQLLGISKNTVYKYARQGIIEPVPNPFNLRKETVYYCKQVDELAAQRIDTVKYTDEYSIPMLAKELKTTRQTIEHIIKANKLEINEFSVGKRTRISLPDATVQTIKKEFANNTQLHSKSAKKLYYNQIHDIALFQPVNASDGATYRVSIKEGVWGIFFGQGLFLSLDELQHHPTISIRPGYSIQSAKIINEQSYVHFKLSRSNTISLILFDYFLSTVGIGNVLIQCKNEYFILSVKQQLISVSKYPLPDQLNETVIQDFIVEGDIKLLNDELFLIGNYQKTSIHLNRQLIDPLMNEADNLNISMSDLINLILKERYPFNE